MGKDQNMTKVLEGATLVLLMFVDRSEYGGYPYFCVSDAD